MARLLRYLKWSSTLIYLCVEASPLESSLRVQTPLGQSSNHIFQSVQDEIGRAALTKRDHDWKTNVTSLDKSWDDVVLLKLGDHATGISVVCTHCYLLGTAYGELSVSGDFNITQAASNVTMELEGTVTNLTHAAETWFKDSTEESFHDVRDLDLSDFTFPTFNYSLDVEVPTVPQANLQFTFHDLELYMLVDTTLSLGSTYTINLYSSETLAGIALNDHMSLGVVLSLDLILSAEATIDISSGFHVRLDDTLKIDIALFGNNVSSITSNGGHFEFLPVTVESAGVVFTATLRLGIHSGFSLHTTDLGGLEIGNHTVPTLGGGIEVAVFANIAELTTNATYQPEHQDCELGIVQSYQMALGAAAGATIDIDSVTWGPAATTSVPIFYTELASACAAKASATTTATATATAIAVATASTSSPLKTYSADLQRRESLITKTISTAITHTGVNCMSTGLINCPASLQNTSQSITTTTFVTVVPSGTDLDDITSIGVQNAVATTVDFGKNAFKLPSSSGSPTSYVPPKSTSTSAGVTSGASGAIGKIGTALEGDVHGVSKKLILGLSIGLGVPVLLAIVAAIVLVIQKRSKYSAVPNNETVIVVGTPDTSDDSRSSFLNKPSKTQARVSEMRTYS